MPRSGATRSGVPEPAEVVQGLRAGLAVIARRPMDVLRVAFARSIRHEVLRQAQGTLPRGVPCAPCEDKELDALAESSHHEGLCVVAKPRRWASAQDLCESLTRARGCAVALDRVRNPYNVGAILRSAAFFGLEGMILGAPAQQGGLAPMAVRVAEGGAEALRIARTTDLAETLARFRARGVHVVGADGRAPSNAVGFRYERPMVLVVGNEREGLDDRVVARCDALVAIRGPGSIESLNVGVAAGVLIAEITRA